MGKLRAVVDAEHFLGVDLDGYHLQPAAVGNRNRVSEIKLPLRVVAANGVKDLQGRGAGERHDAAIAEANRPLRFAGVLFLANRDELTVFCDQPAVAERALRAHTADHHGRPFGKHAPHG
jgi:hypothetical protein